jgi:pimeloyl-ACP methyl ester carboxylesterase
MAEPARIASVQADYVDAGGARLLVRWWASDAGPNVLYWHGGGGGSEELPQIAPALEAAGYSLYAPDAPGYGGSPRLAPQDYRASNIADIATALIDRLAIAPVIWIGFSWGASIGVHAVTRAPDRVKALVLLDGGYLVPEDDPDYDPTLDLDRRIAELQAEIDRGEQWDAPAEILAAAMQGNHDEPTEPHWPKVREAGLPILLVTSTEPPEWEEIRKRGIDRFRAALPTAEVASVSSGHGVLNEAGDDVRRIVLDWLARLG